MIDLRSAPNMQTRTASVAIIWHDMPTRLELPRQSPQSSQRSTNTSSSPYSISTFYETFGDQHSTRTSPNNGTLSSTTSIPSPGSIVCNALITILYYLSNMSNVPIRDLPYQHDLQARQEDLRHQKMHRPSKLPPPRARYARPQALVTVSPHLSCFAQMLIRQVHKFYNSRGQTSWFRTTAASRINAPLPEFMLPGLSPNDLFLHQILDQSATEQSCQIWFRVATSWEAIQLGYEILDPEGRKRQLIFTPNGSPSWVLKDTAKKNYNPHRKGRSSKVISEYVHFFFVAN